MSVITIYPGDQAPKDPADILVYAFDWDLENLATAVTIVTSTWTITPIRPSQTDAALTKDNEVRLTGAQATVALGRTVALDNRVTSLRLTGGTLGQTYEIANKIITSETPAQTKERSFRVRIEQQ